MIEKMKFVSISGPKNDLDRMVNQYLSHYEIQLENALTELRSASKLEPYPGTNPYREPLQKAQKLLASCPGAKQQEISTGTMPVENAITLVNDMDTEFAASDAERAKPGCFSGTTHRNPPVDAPRRAGNGNFSDGGAVQGEVFYCTFRRGTRRRPPLFFMGVRAGAPGKMVHVRVGDKGLAP